MRRPTHTYIYTYVHVCVDTYYLDSRCTCTTTMSVWCVRVYAYMRVMLHEMPVKDKETWRWTVKIAATWGDGSLGQTGPLLHGRVCVNLRQEGPLSDAANCR